MEKKNKDHQNIKFAAFVMTYKRPDIAKETILKLFEQTAPPDRVLIIDNDTLQSGKTIQEQLNHLPISYHANGFNSGPAGAAAIGLQMLAAAGYQWIAWIDDDDPPYFADVFEILLATATKDPRCGSVGVVGHFFNKKRGLIQRVSDDLIKGTEHLKVDTIAGGMIKIVDAKVVTEHHLLPETKLFFGFEELAYDLQMQKAGYTLLVDQALFLRHRIYHNRLQFEKKIVQKTERQLVRDYYSTRNMLFILNKNKLKGAFCYTLLRILYKSLIAFTYGFNYGYKNLKYQSIATYHYFTSQYGQLN